MGTEDKKQQFNDIVEHLTVAYPSLARPVRRRLPRPVLIAVAVLGAIVWGLLSVAMVVWGTRGVALTCTVVAMVAAAVVADARRSR